MKSLLKALISLIVGIGLICLGVSLGGLESLSSYEGIKNLDIRFEAKSIDDQEVYFDDIQELEIEASSVQVRVYEDETLDKIYLKASHLYEGFVLQHKNQTLEIEQPQYWWKKYSDFVAKIDIYVPKGYIFHDVKIETGFGKSSLYGLNSYNIEVDSGFGKLDLNQISCQSLKLETGLGQTTGHRILCQNKLAIDTGVGSVSLDVLTQDNHFDYKVDVGLGNVTLGQKSFSGITDQTSYNGNQLLIDVDCGMGNVEIKMEG